jgi:dTDP-L-rhamnose 4-epimerase
MRVLLSGSCGFIGSHVLDRLLAANHEVVGVDSLEPRVHPSGTKPPWWPDSVRLIHATADKVPYTELTEAECVIHLAAQVGVADSMADPQRYIQQNTAQTSELLSDLSRALARGNLKRLIVASSMSVYGAGGHLVDETAPCVPASVYGLTKYDQERLCLMWGAKHRVETVALRFFNVYGPRQALTNPYTGVLANFAQALLAGKAPIVYEDGGQTRDFIYVQDVADAVIRVATMGGPVFGAYNVCTGWPTSILTAARSLGLALGRPDIEPRITGTKREGDIRDCTGNPDKLRRDTGWGARWSFASGIESYAAWLRSA